MSAPLHILHRFQTDGSGEHDSMLSRHYPGGLLMRVALDRADGVTAEVATPVLTLVSVKGGVTTPVHFGGTVPGGNDNDLYYSIPPGNLMLTVTGGDIDTEYAVGLFIENNRIRRHYVDITLGGDGGGSASVHLDNGGILQTLALTSPNSVDGETVGVEITNSTRWPSKTIVTVFDDDQDIGDTANTDLSNYTPRGKFDIALSSSLPEDTVVRVLFDIMNP